MIFDDRPYVAYDVWPSKAVTPEVYFGSTAAEKRLSGKMKITFTAYNPFGRILVKVCDDEVDYAGVMSDTGVLKAEKMPPSPNADSASFLVYNCGTEKVPMVFRIACSNTEPADIT